MQIYLIVMNKIPCCDLLLFWCLGDVYLGEGPIWDFGLMRDKHFSYKVEKELLQKVVGQGKYDDFSSSWVLGKKTQSWGFRYIFPKILHAHSPLEGFWEPWRYTSASLKNTNSLYKHLLILQMRKLSPREMKSVLVSTSEWVACLGLESKSLDMYLGTIFSMS